MRAKLRDLSGEDVVRILSRFGFEALSQRGSHVKLRRTSVQGARQTLHIPMHAELRRGTLHGIYCQAIEFIPEEDLRPQFFVE